MPDYSSTINRTGADALIPQDVANQIIQELPTKSTFLKLANPMPRMTAKQLKMPVMSGNVTAYFVSGDTGLKQNSNLTWENVYITAEELAVIVPIPEAVLDDASYDIWAEARPRIVEAMGKAIDAAVFHGTNKPDSWPAGIVGAAYDAGNFKSIGTAGLYTAINGEAGVIAKLEDQNIAVTSFIGALSLKAKLRGALDENKQPIFRSAYSNGAAGAFAYELDGMAIEFPDNGALDATQALLIAGNWKYARYAIRQDITFKIFDQGVIQNAAGAIQLNLMQQDSVALRAVMRLGWALPKPINPVSGQSYYPFSVLKPTTIIDIEAAAYSVVAPVKAATPAASHSSGTGYTAAIAWSPVDATFAAETVYTATVTLTAATGYIFAADFSAADITGLPAVPAAATSVTVTRVSDTVVTVVVVYPATAA